MLPSQAERKVRAGLRAVRIINAYLPLPIARWLIRKGVERVQLPDDVECEAISADGVPGVWLRPEGSQQDQSLLYLHGGGFIYGLTSLHLEMVAYLARKMEMPALMVDYRLAPEHPYPAALDDCVTAYRWLLKQGFSASGMVMAGDSAGGNLTLTSLMKLRDSGDPLPAAAACLSPVADMTDKHDRFAQVHDPVLHPRATRFMNQSYVANNDTHDPLLSPVFGRWQDLPPLLIHAGEDEVLRQDAVRIETLAAEAGTTVRLEIYSRMWHVWQIYLSLPQAIQSLDEIASFLKTHVRMSKS